MNVNVKQATLHTPVLLSNTGRNIHVFNPMPDLGFE